MIPDVTQSVCVNCPAGHSCTDPRQAPQSCSNGTYSLVGTTTECTVCPQGYSCPLSEGLPQLCAVGSYAPLGSVECLLCPAGSSCENASLPQPCQPGEFSVEGGMYSCMCVYMYVHMYVHMYVLVFACVLV